VNEAKALNRWFEVNAFRVGEPESRNVAICFSDITAVSARKIALLATYDNLRIQSEEFNSLNGKLQAKSERIAGQVRRIGEQSEELRSVNEELNKRQVELQSLFNNSNAGLVLFDAKAPLHRACPQQILPGAFRRTLQNERNGREDFV